MKKTKLILSLVLIAFTGNLFSQTLIVTDDATYTTGQSSSVLDLKSSSKGFLAPRMLQTERSAITSPATGLLVYQTDAVIGYYYYNGSAWRIIASGTISDYLLLAGGLMTGKLNTSTSTATTSGFTLPHGIAPTTPENGDVWSTTTGIFARINGVTVGPFIGASNTFVQNGNSFATTASLGTNDNNDLAFKTNNTERMRIYANGNVGINTTTIPIAKLDVNGNFKLGASGTVLVGIIKTTVSITNNNEIKPATGLTLTANVSGATVGSTVIVNPRTALSIPVGIGYSYVSAPDKVTIFLTVTNGTGNLGTSPVIFDITIIQ